MASGLDMDIVLNDPAFPSADFTSWGLMGHAEGQGAGFGIRGRSIARLHCIVLGISTREAASW